MRKPRAVCQGCDAAISCHGAGTSGVEAESAEPRSRTRRDRHHAIQGADWRRQRRNDRQVGGRTLAGGSIHAWHTDRMEESMSEVAINAPNLWRLETPGHTGWERTAHADDPKKYFIVSTDSHANEPPDLWEKRIDPQYRERVPRIIT